MMKIEFTAVINPTISGDAHILVIFEDDTVSIEMGGNRIKLTDAQLNQLFDLKKRFETMQQAATLVTS